MTLTTLLVQSTHNSYRDRHARWSRLLFFVAVPWLGPGSLNSIPGVIPLGAVLRVLLELRQRVMPSFTTSLFILWSWYAVTTLNMLSSCDLYSIVSIWIAQVHGTCRYSVYSTDRNALFKDNKFFEPYLAPFSRRICRMIEGKKG